MSLIFKVAIAVLSAVIFMSYVLYGVKIPQLKEIYNQDVSYQRSVANVTQDSVYFYFDVFNKSLSVDSSDEMKRSYSFLLYGQNINIQAAKYYIDSGDFESAAKYLHDARAFTELLVKLNYIVFSLDENMKIREKKKDHLKNEILILNKGLFI